MKRRPSAAGPSDTWRKASRGCWCGKGAGVSPLFPPQFASSDDAREAVLAVIHQRPRDANIDRTRWTLRTLRSVLQWLRCRTDAGLHQLLERLGISYQRGRHHIHSPDPDYQAKLAA